MNTVTGEVKEVPDAGATPTPSGAGSLYDMYKTQKPANTLASAGMDQSPDITTPTAPKPPRSLEGFMGNLGQDVSSLVQGVKSLPKVVAQQSVGGQFARKLMRTPDVIKQQVDILTKPGENKMGRMVGAQMGASPEIEQGKLIGEVAKTTAQDYWSLLTDPAKAFYDHPVNSTLDALTILGAGSKAFKSVKAKFDNVPRTTELATTLYNVDPRSADVATKTFAGAFTIPTKRAKDLRPLDVSKKMMDYGIQGSLDDLKNVANKVTGRTGVIADAQREVLSKIPDTINLEGMNEAIIQYGKTLSLSADEIQTILDRVHTKVGDVAVLSSAKPKAVKVAQTVAKGPKTYVLGNKAITPMADVSAVEPLDAFEIMQQTQKEASAFARKSTYLTSVPHAEEMGKLYSAVAQQIEEELALAVKNNNLIAATKTPERLSKLMEVSPKLAQEFMKVKTFRDMRAIQSPFVRLGQMVDLTLDAELSAARKLGVALGGRLGATATGGMVAGIPGMIVGSAIGPSIEPMLMQATQNIGPKIATGLGTAMSKGAPVAAKAGANIRALGAGAKNAAAAAFIRKLLMQGETPTAVPTPPAPQQVPTTVMTQSMRDMIPQ